MSASDRIAREKAIAIIPKFTAFLSVLGSGFIIYDIVCSHFNISPDFWCRKKKNSKEFGSGDGFSSRTTLANSRGRSTRRFAQRKTLKNSAYYRLMLCMSISDFFVSFAWFCTTWPIPKDENSADNPSEFLYGNIGNMQTCNAQAFFIQLGIITPFYNALLACYYYLTIRREWKEDDFRCRVEYAGHIFSVTFGLGTAIAGVVMGIFNNSSVWCWISAYPSGCGDRPGEIPCERGGNSHIFRWLFYYGPLWVMIFLVALFMSLVYTYVRGLDNKMDQYTLSYRQNAARTDSGSTEFHGGGQSSGQNIGGRRKSLMARTFSTMNTDTLNEQRRQRRNERSKAVANQGLFYAGTFALVWVFATIVRAMQLAGATPPWTIKFWFAVFTPAQGFFNFLVYIRPRLIQYLEQRKKRKKGQRGSRTCSSFNSEILHVSGISGASSSQEVTGENQNQDTSSQSDVALSEPFVLPKVRFAASHRKLATKQPEESQNTTIVRFATTKVRFLPDDTNLDTEEKGDDAELTNSVVGTANVDVALDKEENGEVPDAGVGKTESIDTIDQALLSSITSDKEDEKEESSMAKESGGKLVQLHNATIDLATGEVRTRMSTRRVLPP